MYNIIFYDVIIDFGEGPSKIFFQRTKSGELKTKKFFVKPISALGT